MSVLVLSISQKTATVGLLGQVSLDDELAGKLCHALVGGDQVTEAMVLSTCNRTEIYADVDRFHAGLDELTAQLAAVTGLDLEVLRGACSVHFDDGAVAHAFRVAAGLESMVVGENQILGQVRAALTAAQRHDTIASVLNSLFQQSIRVGKRVQAETTIGSAGRSLLTAALHELSAEIGGLAGHRVAVIGAGSMAGLAARTVQSEGATVSLVNRSPDRARRLADSIGATAHPLADLDAVLDHHDVLITCTGARDQLIAATMLDSTPVRAVIDLALPADADPAIGERLPLINLDRLMQAEHTAAAATQEVDAARDLVATEVHDFLARRRAARVTPTVVALRSMASDVVSAELDRMHGRVNGLTEQQRAEIDKTVRRVADKLLHHPTVRVQEFAAAQDHIDYAAAVRELFDLDPQSVEAVMSTNVADGG